MTTEQYTEREQAVAASEDELICPDCQNPLHDDWHGVLACFCKFGGKCPTAEEIICAVDAEKREHLFSPQPTRRFSEEAAELVHRF